jgi:hypothetical protein
MKNENTILKDVTAGTIFVYDNKKYIKTATIYEDEHRIMALNMNNWKIYYFRFDTIVKEIIK